MFCKIMSHFTCNHGLTCFILWQTRVRGIHRFEWNGAQYGDVVELEPYKQQGTRVYIRNMDVDFACCSK